MNTDKRLNTVPIKTDGITLINKSLNPTKAYVYDNISISMIQLCRDSATLQIYKSLLNQVVFPHKWKMANIIHFLKKEAKYLVKNYRLVSLLPIFANVFERL